MRCNEKKSVIMRRLVLMSLSALMICLLIFLILGVGQGWETLATGAQEQLRQKQTVDTMAEISRG